MLVRIALLFSLAFTAVTSSGLAQVPENQMTGAHLNGRFWLIQSNDGRVDFLLGYTECLLLFPTPLPESLKKLLQGTGANVPPDPWVPEFPASLSYGEIAKALTRFYEEPENLQVTIWQALQIIAMKVDGKTPDELQKATSQARAEAKCKRDPDRCLQEMIDKRLKSTN